MERRAISVHGIVQGVGFRPFAYGLASRLGLAGFVRNQTGSVLIEVEGEAGSIDHFVDALRTDAPPLAQIDAVECRPRPVRGESRFQIENSEFNASAPVCISPDVATCDDCLAELFDPADRRWRYPFINCTNCGPRLSIVRGAPYDRQRTTMAAFRMCEACRGEYENPLDRRFHAQPIACPACGPRLSLLDSHSTRIECDDLMTATADALRQGRIVAIKGLGGFHLACDARNESAVCELRRRKHRDEKPLAVMTRDLKAAEEFCEIGDTERELLRSRARPIVLLHKRPACDLAGGVAPDNPNVGVMLPYTPLHHVLLHDLRDMMLVMTSGNRSDEPIAYDDADAIDRLSGIADFFLTHDRQIHVRCDDSVTKVVGESESPIRRSRGYAPQPVQLPVECPEPILAVGGQLKATFALGRGHHAILSHHLGDLDHLEAARAFERDIELYQQSFGLDPRAIAHDLHPDYASTRYALQRGERQSARCIAIQHHHAHMASCMAEHGLDETVIGVSFDGTGFGTDGAIWGGEFLVGDLADFTRAAHLRYVPMPGGEKAIKEPWRMAVAHLDDAGADCPSLVKRLDPMTLRTIRRALARRLNAPPTSSAGRLFDAVASLVGVRDTVSFEGQAAMRLEWLAEGYADLVGEPYDIVLVERSKNDDQCIPEQIDTRVLIRAVAGDVNAGVNPAEIAARFHATLARTIADVCARIREQTRIDRVMLSGGVFSNGLLTRLAHHELEARGFHALCHRRVPPNDGGLSFGQVAVAAKRLANVTPASVGTTALFPTRQR